MPKTSKKTPSQQKSKKPADEPTFEEAMNELEDITRKLEGGSLSLDESIRAYERGIELQKICQSKLNEAQRKLEYLKRREDGSLERLPIDDAMASQSDLAPTEQARLFQD